MLIWCFPQRFWIHVLWRMLIPVDYSWIDFPVSWELYRVFHNECFWQYFILMCLCLFYWLCIVTVLVSYSVCKSSCCSVKRLCVWSEALMLSVSQLRSMFLWRAAAAEHLIWKRRFRSFRKVHESQLMRTLLQISDSVFWRVSHVVHGQKRGNRGVFLNEPRTACCWWLACPSSWW